MAYNNNDYQRKFKEKLYKAGLKQIIVWVKRKDVKNNVKMTQREFNKKLRGLAAGWDAESQSRLYTLLIRVAKGKKEAEKHIKK